MDTAVVFLLVLGSLVVLGLSVRNYLRARKSLAAAEKKAVTAQEGFFEIKDAVKELESWASEYLDKESVSHRSNHSSDCLVKTAAGPSLSTSFAPSTVVWQALAPALTTALKVDPVAEEHLLVLFRWAMASNNKASARWYVNALRETPITDEACKWLLQESDVWNVSSSSVLPARTAAYLKGSFDSRELGSSRARRAELAL